MIAIITGVNYYAWRVTSFNTDDLFFTIILFCAEIAGLLTFALHAFMTTRVAERRPAPPLEGVTIDVFVTTYNEPVEMLRQTLIAARAMKLPHRVVLLDDGRRAEMARLADELGVAYLARTDNAHAKAGNINHALAHSTAEFVAIFDADHVPHEDFLFETLGFFRDPKVAFVQTPQDFYNLDSFQHRPLDHGRGLWSEQEMFFQVVQPGKDVWNAAFFCGSCAILRRAALDDIGGLAVGTVTEDLHTSLRIHKKGWSSVFYARSLAFGLAPEGLEPYEVQRERWGAGAMQVWRQEGVIFAPGLTIPQKLCYLASIITYFDAWQRVVYYSAPCLTLALGVIPIRAENFELFSRLIPWLGAIFLLDLELGRGHAKIWIAEQYNFLRFPAFLRATLTIFSRGPMTFAVTPKWSKAHRQALRYAPLVAVPVLCAGAIAVGAARMAHAPHLPLSAYLWATGWALLIIALAVSALAFARSRRRKDGVNWYSARLPVLVTIEAPGGRAVSVATQEISPEALTLATPFSLDPAVGAILPARLDLPGGLAEADLEVLERAVVFPADSPARLSLRCRIGWRRRSDADALAQMVVSDAVERRVRMLRTMDETPSARIAAAWRRLFAPEAAQPPRPAPGLRVWRAAQVMDTAAPAAGEWVAVLAEDARRDHWRIAARRPLAPGEPLALEVEGERWPVIVAQVAPTPRANESVAVARTVRASEEVRARPLRAAAALLALVALSTLAARPEAFAAEPFTLAGAEAGPDTSYAYAAAIVPVSERYGLRIWADRLTYAYETGGRQIDAEAYGAQVAAMRMWSGPWGWANLSLGAAYRDTDLSPDDPGNDNAGGKADAIVGFDGARRIGAGPWRVTGVASYLVDQENAFLRLGADRAVGERLRLGLDAQRSADPNYDARQVAATAAFATRSGRTTLSARLGYSTLEDGDDGLVAGVGLALSLR